MRIIVMLILTGGLCAQASEAPRTFAINANVLDVARERIKQGDASLAHERAVLCAEADKLLELVPASVLDKPRTAASGDRHDYYSIAPYWWPDPAKPDGLPYILRDGEVNLDSRTGTDMAALRRTCESVETLGLAYWFTADQRYARKAATLIRVWFLNPATRMNPNFEHAQAIPGHNVGRGTGLIEARHLVRLNDGLALLAGSTAWPATDAAAMREWLTDYYRWLTTSKNGDEEANAENNHGSWYDVQAVDLALILGRVEDAKKILSAVPQKRIARQIEPDGSQPLELKRTRSLNYVLFNLEALELLARLGQHVDLDLWKFSTGDGRSLIAALKIVAPFVDPRKAWMKKDLDAADRARINPLLIYAGGGSQEAFPNMTERPQNDERWRLWRAW